MPNRAKPPIFAETRRHPAGARLAPHVHDEGQLGITLAGTMAIMLDAGRMLAPAGRAIWVPPRVSHAAAYSEASHIVQVLVPGALATALPDVGAVIEVSPLLRELAIEASLLPEPGHQPRADVARAAIGGLIVREVAKPRPLPALLVPLGRDPRLVAVTDRLITDPGCRMDLAALARDAGASPRTLARLFRTETGMSFARWRDHWRINVAIDRLSQGESITRTAFDLGYQSPAAFTAMFRRVTGQPPGRMIRALTDKAR